MYKTAFNIKFTYLVAKCIPTKKKNIYKKLYIFFSHSASNQNDFTIHIWARRFTKSQEFILIALIPSIKFQINFSINRHIAYVLHTMIMNRKFKKKEATEKETKTSAPQTNLSFFFLIFLVFLLNFFHTEELYLFISIQSNWIRMSDDGESTTINSWNVYSFIFDVTFTISLI